jgi:uncharacterized membrane protein YfhO
MVLDVEAREETIVGTSVPAWPGWKAKLDGGAVAPFSYNHAFLGFRVPKGVHRLELHYRPEGFVLGAAASLLTLAVSVLALLVRRRPSAAPGAVSP